MRNCPNCGAPFGTGTQCPYCGTLDDSVISAAIGKPMRLLFDHDGYSYELSVVPTSLTANSPAEPTSLYSDGGEYLRIYNSPKMTLDISFDVVQRDDALMKVRKTG